MLLRSPIKVSVHDSQSGHVGRHGWGVLKMTLMHDLQVRWLRI